MFLNMEGNMGGILNVVGSVLSIVDKLLPTKDKMKDSALLKENQELQKAIQEGDMEKVERIRERKKNYKNLLGLFLVLCVCGCGTTRVQNVPILGDNIPVKLEVGSEVTLEGGTKDIVHSNKNTLVSDAYVYQSVVSHDEKKK